MTELFRTKEQRLFSKLLAKHLNEVLDAPLLLEGATGLGKTRAYLVPLFKAAKAGRKIAIVLPTHQLIDQLLGSGDLRSCRMRGVSIQDFRPRLRFDSQAGYKEQKDRARDADILLCTSASVIIDQRLQGGYNGVTQREYLLFDEADELPGTAALQSDIEIPAYVFKEHRIAVTDAREAVEQLLGKQEVEPEYRAAGKVILEAIAEPAWYQDTGINTEGGVALLHQLPGRLLKKIANRPQTAFVSATLSIGDKFDDFKRAMGIEEISRLSEIIEPEKFGDLKFTIEPQEAGNEDWRAAVTACIETAPKPCLVVTTSHDDAAAFGERYAAAVVRQGPGEGQEDAETVTVAAARLDQDPGKDTLIAAAAWAGLDTPAIVWKSVIVPRIPFPPPKELDNEQLSHYVACRSTAIRRMRQVIGRGLRSPDAESKVFILDARYKQVESFVPRRFTEVFQKAVQEAWLEGDRKVVILSKIERSTAHRQAAFKRYGKQCQVCDFTPRADAQLEIHHKDPLSEGKRKTRLEDLAVLCANCHRLAHTEAPPITVEGLRSLNSSPVL